MNPIVTDFTPISATLGGALIGLASVLLMAFRGNIYGATGILSGAIFPSSSSDWRWRVVLILGMITGPLVYLMFAGEMPAIDVPASPLITIIGGILVGIGVTFGSGCTSGHGVCGIARLSPRSIVATITFMATTAITVFVVRHLIAGGV